MRQGPKKFQRAMGLMVNEAAFAFRDEMFDSLKTRLMVRRPAFVKRHLWVTRARIGGPSPVAVVGSTRSRDGSFEGWAAQQFGEDVDRKRVPTLLARGRNKRRVVRKGARLVKGRDLPTAAEIAGKSTPGAVVAMMRILARRGDRRPFIIFPGEHPRFRGGLYQMRGRKDRRDRKARLEMLQNFESPNEQPKRVNWVNPAWKAYKRKHTARAEFRKAMNRVGLRDALMRG